VGRWSGYEQDEQPIFARGACARGADGAGARGRARAAPRRGRPPQPALRRIASRRQARGHDPDRHRDLQGERRRAPGPHRRHRRQDRRRLARVAPGRTHALERATRSAATRPNRLTRALHTTLARVRARSVATWTMPSWQSCMGPRPKARRVATARRTAPASIRRLSSATLISGTYLRPTLRART